MPNPAQNEVGCGVVEGDAVAVSGLSKRYGMRMAVRDVSFALPRGATLVVFGANGAGKTTLLRMLATIERPTSGSVSVFGVDPRENGNDVRASLGFISHEPMLYPDLSAMENLLLFARLYGVPDPAGRAWQLLRLVRLEHRANDSVRGFSRGMTQRMSMARALVHDPALILLDEPYSGLDASATAIAQQLFLSAEPIAAHPSIAGHPGAHPHSEGLCEDGRRTVIMASHDLAQGYKAASHLLLLSHGRQVLYAKKDDISFEAFLAAYDEQISGGTHGAM